MNDLQTLVASRVADLQTTTKPAEVDIPAAIDKLIDNKLYYRKYRKLIRDGHLADLLELAALAADKQRPSHWFATVCAKANWERTLAFLAKLRAVRDRAERVAKRLGTEVNRFIYKQVWRGRNVERWAAQAAEAGRTPLKLFAWLCRREAPPGTAAAGLS
jgi:hypothetical protein